MVRLGFLSFFYILEMREPANYIGFSFLLLPYTDTKKLIMLNDVKIETQPAE